MISIFDPIIEKYKLESNSYEHDTLVQGNEYEAWLQSFLDKWGGRFIKGYWNLDVGYLPMRWCGALDEALDMIAEESPEFGIVQIKIKFGGIRIYLSDISDSISDGVEHLERVLYDDRFVF